MTHQREKKMETRNGQDKKATLVLGGRGKTGRRVVQRLSGRGVLVRVGSRSAEGPFDWENQDTWAAALKGVGAVYVSYYPDVAIPGAVEAVRSFSELAVESGIRRLVLLSGRGPHIDAEATSQEEIRAGIERMQGLWDYFVQNAHPGTIQLDGDTASGRAYISELMHGRDGSSQLNYSVYHDRYQRTPEGWKFTERVYEVRYLNTTPLAGSAPHAAGGAR